MKSKTRKWRRRLKIFLVLLAVLTLCFLVIFPGRQRAIAFTLATGVGMEDLQNRIDEMEEKAIRRESFSEDDREFIRSLYTCFYKGGRLSVVIRQSGRMMEHYLNGSGEDLEVSPRIFVKSGPVKNQLFTLITQCLHDRDTPEGIQDQYSSPVFYMGDAKFPDAFVGLYFGRIFLRPGKQQNGKIAFHVRAECPWEWPSYPSLFEKYGDYHAQCFPLPNVRSLIAGPDACLRIDDGLGAHLAVLGMAEPFLVWSEWTVELPSAVR